MGRKVCVLALVTATIRNDLTLHSQVCRAVGTEWASHLPTPRNVLSRKACCTATPIALATRVTDAVRGS